MRKHSVLVASFVLQIIAISSIGQISSSKQWTGKVVAVTDGDTIAVMHDGKAEKIRLHGVDSPEGGQPFGARAKQFTSDQCFGKVVTVQVTDTDRYGRTVGNVTLPDGTSLNLKLVENGFAWWYKQYAPREFALQKAQTDATLKGVGLWSEPQPIAPWDWRAGKQGTTSSGPLTSQPMRSPIQQQIVPPVAKRLPEQQQAESHHQQATVYATATGTKYHTDGCRYLAKSKLAITLNDAFARGLTPCSVCSAASVASIPSANATPTLAPRAPPTAQVTSPTTQAFTEPTQTVQTATVYVTNTGSKYHRDGCRYLSKSKIPISLSDAQARGYVPCMVCRP